MEQLVDFDGAGFLWFSLLSIFDNQKDGDEADRD
jgi:hypothetical protein